MSEGGREGGSEFEGGREGVRSGQDTSFSVLRFPSAFSACPYFLLILGLFTSSLVRLRLGLEGGLGTFAVSFWLGLFLFCFLSSC